MLKKLAVSLLVGIIAGIAFYQTGCAQSGASGIGSGSTVTDFTLSDVAGNEISLRDFFGNNVILLIFSATWCPPCNREIPELKRLHEEYGPKGLKIIDVYIRESKEKMAAFVRKNGIPYTILLDLDGAVAQRYGIQGIPTFIVIDKTGMIRKRGYPPSRQYVSVFEPLLGD